MSRTDQGLELSRASGYCRKHYPKYTAISSPLKASLPLIGRRFARKPQINGRRSTAAKTADANYLVGIRRSNTPGPAWQIIDGCGEQYARARDKGYDLMADDIADIADHDNTEQARQRIDVRKWLMSKALPKKYGDKQTIDGKFSVD